MSYQKNGCCDWELNSSVPKKEIHKAKFTTRQEGPLNTGSLVEYLKSRVHAPDIAPEPKMLSHTLAFTCRSDSSRHRVCIYFEFQAGIHSPINGSTFNDDRCPLDCNALMKCKSLTSLQVSSPHTSQKYTNTSLCCTTLQSFFRVPDAGISRS